VPTSISPEAQSMLALGAMELPEYPALDDFEGWRKLVEFKEQRIMGMLAKRDSGGAVVEVLDADGVDVYVITPGDLAPDDTRIYFDIHGGGLNSGRGECCQAMGVHTAAELSMHVWAPDYRMPPEHPYPAALDDCIAAYRVLIARRDPSQVVVGGSSAGGNLAAALMLRARDEGLPLPAATLLITPEVDLTESGDSFQTNLGIDTMLTASLMPANLLYAGGHDLSHPYLSPLFGDFSIGFPPTLLSAGTRDLFLSNAVRMHRALRAAGVPAELHVFEAAPHGGFFGGTPEDRELRREMRRFVDEYCPPAEDSD
jgi:acetyl esterase/lipase